MIRQLADSARLAVIVGPAGTGKTAALAAAHQAWQAAGVENRYDVAILAVTRADVAHLNALVAPHSSPKANSEQHHCISAPTAQPTLRRRRPARDADR